MKKNFENAMLNKQKVATTNKQYETAFFKKGINYDSGSYAFDVGDTVRIKNTETDGSIGKIIAIRADIQNDRFIYTVQFSDKETRCVSAVDMQLLQKGTVKEHR